jgi:hypothetical protein
MNFNLNGDLSLHEFQSDLIKMPEERFESVEIVIKIETFYDEKEDEHFEMVKWQSMIRNCPYHSSKLCSTIYSIKL